MLPVVLLGWFGLCCLVGLAVFGCVGCSPLFGFAVVQLGCSSVGLVVIWLAVVALCWLLFGWPCHFFVGFAFSFDQVGCWSCCCLLGLALVWLGGLLFGWVGFVCAVALLG